MEQETNLLEILEHLHPADCDYQEWCDVGMALKQEGYTAEDWERWSARDPGRYHNGECARKWKSFNGNSNPVTGGTIYHLAIQHGWQPERSGYELDWDSEIDQDGVVVDTNWIENRDVKTPSRWHPAQQLTTYLQTLFEPGETVGFVTKSWKNDKGKYIPKDKGIYNKTAGQLIEELAASGDDIGSVVGDYDQNGGAWIRFNPLDGNGVRNDNVTEYRYALVESDDMEIERQNAIIRELELPIAILVHSGGKSLHAIVRIDASDYTEYRKRVDYLYEICEKNGMIIDKQNRNPSRLSRMPGCVRGDKKQYIVDTNIGKGSWTEWQEWIESVNDNLPSVEPLAAAWDNLPDLAPPLIDGMLRQGHKMLISGPSKAGKSYMLIQLVIAIAEGRHWLGRWQCACGRVLYVNLELDSASCLHRFRDVYTALGWDPRHLNNIDIWNLRGKTVPMDKLAPKLIRRASKQGYKAIVIDPIYKVITGDENSADQMAKFCNQFDLVCTELQCAVIYCHHHSKGAQGGKKAIDRASGSGVFARDPDAVIDMIELETTEDLMLQQENKGLCNVSRGYLEKYCPDHDLSADDMLNSRVMIAYCENTLDQWQMQALRKQLNDEIARCAAMTAWRIDGTLREFQKFEPVNLWFRYPIHLIDQSGALQDVIPELEKSSRQMLIEARRKKTEQEKADHLSAINIAFEGLEQDGVASVVDIAEQIGVSTDTIKRWFVNGRRSRKEYKKLYDTYEDPEDKRLYLRRKDNKRE